MLTPLVAALGLGAAFLLALECLLALHDRLRRRVPGGGAEALDADEEPNAYLRELRARGAGRFVDTLFPHPYLAWVHHANPPAGLPQVNNVGLFGPDFPPAKDPGAFTILLTGGSVASQLGQNVAGWPRYLEEVLNRRWATGDGREFVVLNGGVAAWKQPQQAILFLLYAEVVDAVVTLDGWNEHYMLTAGERFEYPASSFHLANPLATRSVRQLAGIWLSGGLDRWVRARPLLARSRLARAAAHGLRAAISRVLVERAPGRAGRATSVESLFAFPPGWDERRRFAHALRSYVKHVVAIDAVAATWGVRTAHFLQPVPAIDKELTAEERAVVGDLGYRERYGAMVEELLRLRRLGVPVFSLTDLFRDCRDTVYADWSHLVRDPATGESAGYRRMAARMAAVVAEAWGLEARREADVGRARA